MLRKIGIMESDFYMYQGWRLTPNIFNIHSSPEEKIVLNHSFGVKRNKQDCGRVTTSPEVHGLWGDHPL